MDKKPTVYDCTGCRDDFYNHREGGGTCWNLESATFIKMLSIPRDLPPPYKSIKATVRPSCYRQPGFVRVKPEALDIRGYWKR